MGYAETVWMTNTLTLKIKCQLKRQHYRAVRAAYKDMKCKFKREEEQHHLNGPDTQLPTL